MPLALAVVVRTTALQAVRHAELLLAYCWPMLRRCACRRACLRYRFTPRTGGCTARRIEVWQLRHPFLSTSSLGSDCTFARYGSTTHDLVELSRPQSHNELLISVAGEDVRAVLLPDSLHRSRFARYIASDLLLLLRAQVASCCPRPALQPRLGR